MYRMLSMYVGILPLLSRFHLITGCPPPKKRHKGATHAKQIFKKFTKCKVISLVLSSFQIQKKSKVQERFLLKKSLGRTVQW